jgi:hypothetical protein
VNSTLYYQVDSIIRSWAGIPPITTVLTAQVANATKRRLIGKAADTIKNAYATIRNQAIQGRNQRRAPKNIPGERMITWLYKILPRDIWKNDILRQVITSNERPTPWKIAIYTHTRQSWDKL